MGTKKGQNKNPFLFTLPIPIYPVQAQKNLADGERVYIYHVFSMLTFTKYYEMNNQTQLSRSSTVGRHKITTVSHHITHTNTSSLGKKKRTRKKTLQLRWYRASAFGITEYFQGKLPPTVKLCGHSYHQIATIYIVISHAIPSSAVTKHKDYNHGKLAWVYQPIQCLHKSNRTRMVASMSVLA